MKMRFALALLFSSSLMPAAVFAQDLMKANEFTLEASEIRAQLTPVQKATISASMSGEISHLDIRDGEKVKKGQTLIRFRCDTERARVQKANAELKMAQNKLKGHQRMAQLEAIGEIELENARLEVDRAKAELNILRSVMDKCVVHAPFSGDIGEKLVDAREFVELGKPMLEMQDSSSLIVEFIAPSKWASWLQPDFAFNVMIADTQKSYPAKLLYTASKVDALSQSIKVYAKIDGQFTELLPGMSGFVDIKTPSNHQ